MRHQQNQKVKLIPLAQRNWHCYWMDFSLRRRRADMIDLPGCKRKAWNEMWTESLCVQTCLSPYTEEGAKALQSLETWKYTRGEWSQNNFCFSTSVWGYNGQEGSSSDLQSTVPWHFNTSLECLLIECYSKTITYTYIYIICKTNTTRVLVIRQQRKKNVPVKQVLGIKQYMSGAKEIVAIWFQYSK